MVSSTCLHFCVSLRTPHLPYQKKNYFICLNFYTRSTQLQFYNTWHTCCGVQPLLSYSADHREIIAVGMIITQSQQESQNKTGTQQEQEEHSTSGYQQQYSRWRTWEVLKVLEHRVKCHLQLEMDWRLSWCCKAARILTLKMCLLSMVKIEKEDAFCRWSMFVLF